MSEPALAVHGSSADDYADFAADIAAQVEGFLVAVREIARGTDPASTLPLLLLQVSQLALAGGRVGAISDVVPDQRFEPDPGPDPDVDELRHRLADLLEPVDGYLEVVDPVDSARGADEYRLSDDIAGIASDLLHGLTHFRAGHVVEALWWWQFSYLSSWGGACAAVMRTLHSLIAHSRLDMDRDPVTDAEDELLAEVASKAATRR